MKHREQVLALLKKQIGTEQEVLDIGNTAAEVVGKWVNPLTGGKEEINGLIYGLVQSGKTGVLTVTGAIGADEGAGVDGVLARGRAVRGLARGVDERTGRVRRARELFERIGASGHPESRLGPRGGGLGDTPIPFLVVVCTLVMVGGQGLRPRRAAPVS